MRSSHRHPLEMRELPSTGPKTRVHQHVRLQRAAETTLASSGATGEGRDLAAVLGQERDDAVGVAIVDGAQEKSSTFAGSTRHGTGEDSSIGSCCAGARRC